ncbi:DUF899 domain-containing protein [Pseudonocardia sp. DSM 110487]|uniref:DUF899 family protein n=1 Tax=Pseudonocardia sp. DSM 110487 TaxID=2865833 RepID=UPI001C6A5AFC|nr:DUF899 family protein [Pseudonocardia sp. DSM 110487]QYN31700.1 DUF899 domain-containing protein [Pseudonocardia sp. DSM 110487]
MSAPPSTELAPEALPPVVTPQEWAVAAAELRAAEKEHMRAGDALAARRRRMPMVEFGGYTFEGADGPATLLDLFEGRRQLVVYQFMAGPPWCQGCCLFTDQISHLAHLHARDTTMANVSLSRYEDLAALRERMGWQVPFYSSLGNDFATDCGTAEGFGLSVFLRHDDRVFRTYFTTDRGGEAIGTVWSILDRTPLGRQETWEDTPAGRPQTAPYQWWRLHDEY